jgi:hypothetical protein
LRSAPWISAYIDGMASFGVYWSSVFAKDSSGSRPSTLTSPRYAPAAAASAACQTLTPLAAAIHTVRPSPQRPPGVTLPDADCDAAIDAMRIASEKQTEGILDNSRRQHQGHAARFVASCVACAQEPRVRVPEMGHGSPPEVLASLRVQTGVGASV